MEEIDVQILNAVDGFCDCEAPDRVPYFDSLKELLDAFNSVAANCGARDSCMLDTKQLSNRLRQATPMLTTRKRRYDASALLFLVSNILCPGSSACTRGSLDVTASRLGIHVWASLRPSGAFGEEGGEALVPADGEHDVAIVVHEAPATPEPCLKRVKLQSLIGACSPDDQAQILGKFGKLSRSKYRARKKNKRLKHDLEAVIRERDELLIPYRNESVHLKAQGDFKLSRKRNIGHTAASALVQILDMRATTELILRIERRGGAAHYILGRQLVTQFNGDSATSDCRRFRVFIIRTDAFSSSTARTDSAKLAV